MLSFSSFLFFSLPQYFALFSLSLIFQRYKEVKQDFLLKLATGRMSIRAYFPTEFSCGDVFDRKVSEVEVVDDSRELILRDNGDMDLQHHHAIEFDIEFWPVEHPMEPPDEDRPVKCPMPASSSINIDVKRNEERVAAESSRKRSELPEMVTKGIAVATEPPVRAVRKRHHHTLSRDDHIMKPLVRMPPLPPLPTQNLTIFQMLQEFDKFNS